MTRYVVYDTNGVICETPNYEEAQDSFETEDSFEGDLTFAEIINLRR